MVENKNFEPVIVGFFCNWCTSAAADLAGTSRLKYPPNIRPIRVMCSGTVDPVYVLRAMLEGADAVIIGGCHPGDCHYINGNYKLRRRIAILKTIFKTLGLDERRIRLEWISAAEGNKFARIMKEYTEEVKEMGPSPLKNAEIVGDVK